MVRRLLGGIVALPMTLGLGVPAVTAVPADPAPTVQVRAETSPGAEDFAACVRGERDARLVLLIDESGSLKTSDPEAGRVDAAQHLVRSWGRQVEDSDITLEVQVMSFYDTGRASTEWVPVQQAEDLFEDLEAYRARQEGDQTDYLMGLNAARSALMEDGERGQCRAIVWFSDGRLEAGPYYMAEDESVLKPYIDDELEWSEVSRIAEGELCRVGGAADQLRAADIKLMAIGLASEASEQDFDLMRAIATDSSCGALAPTGSFLLADDLESLLFAFANVARPEPPVTQDSAVCQGELSQECLHSFVLDDSISGVTMMITSQIAGLDVVIVPPDAEPVTLTAAAGTVQGEAGPATVQVDRLSDRTSNLEMTATDSWRGQWGVALVDPDSSSAAATSQSALHLTADIEPVWIQGDDALRAGESPELTFGLQRRDGTPIDPNSLLGTVQLDVALLGADRTALDSVEGLTAQDLAAEHPMDLTAADPGSATLHSTLNLTTADFETAEGERIKGTALAPVQVQERLEIQPPAGFPQVSDSVSFGRVLDAREARAELTVTGPGCVWVEGGSVQVAAGPEAAMPVQLGASADSAENCLRVEEGETATLPLTLGTAEAALGGLSGQFDAHLSTIEGPAREATIALGFSADLDKSPNRVVWGTTVALLIALGVGIPLALMYLMKWRSSRIPGRGLLGQTFPLELEDGRLVPGSFSGSLTSADLRDPISVPRKGARTLQVGDATLSARPGLSPFGVGEVHASVPGQIGLSESSKVPTKDGSARLPLAVHNKWAVFRHPAGDSGTLLVLSSLERSREDVEQELQDLASRIDDDLKTLAESDIAPGPSHAGRAASRGVRKTSRARKRDEGAATAGATSTEPGSGAGDFSLEDVGTGTGDFGADIWGGELDTAQSPGPEAGFTPDTRSSTPPGTPAPADLAGMSDPSSGGAPDSSSGPESDFDFDFDFGSETDGR